MFKGARHLCYSTRAGGISSRVRQVAAAYLHSAGAQELP